jgi:CheY-like chemotaxis protein
MDNANAGNQSKFFAIFLRLIQSHYVKQPLALVLYEQLMPGGRLINRLQDMNYRVLTATDPATVVPLGVAEKPLLIFADLVSESGKVCSVIAELRNNPGTAHVPVIAFADDGLDELMTAAQTSGATVVVNDAAILSHLPQLVERALHGA